MRISAKIAIVLACVIAAVSIGTVCATWTFSSGTKADSAAGIDIDLEVFGWTGSEALSSGDGSNHAELILRIISALNGTLDGESYDILINNIDTRQNPSLISNYNYESRSYYGSMDAGRDIDRNSISDIFTEDTENLDFIITWEYSNGTYSYVIYTTSINLGDKGSSSTPSSSITRANYHKHDGLGNPTIPYGEYIYCIYKTTVTTDSNGDYIADATQEGKAKMCWYEEGQEVGAMAKEIPSFDTSTWTATSANTDIGGSISDAIWTFNGDTPTVYADAATDVWYYKMATEGLLYNEYSYTEWDGTTSIFGGTDGTTTFSTIGNTTHSYDWNQAGTYNITTTALNATITVYDGSESTVVTGTRYTPDLTTVTNSDGSTVKTQTTTDTIKYSDGTYTVTAYTITTTTAADGTVSSTMTGRIFKYDSEDDQYPDDTAIFNDTGEISDLTIDFYANTASYYYIEVTGATEIPLTITNTTAS